MSDKKQIAPVVPQFEELDPDTINILRGNLAIGSIRDALEEAGVAVPEDFKFKAIDRKSMAIANSAVFALMGGVPGYLLWASQNPGKFYEKFMMNNEKEGPTAFGMNINTQKIEIVSPIGSNPLDDVELDELGRVKDKKDDDIIDL